MDARSHTSHSDAHVTASQTLTNYHTFCINMLIFTPPVLLSERKTAVKKLILCSQWKTERSWLWAAICAGLGLNDLQRALQWIGHWAKNRSWESWSLILYSLHKCCLLSLSICCVSHTGRSGTQLDFAVARGHVALERLHSGIFHQLHCKSPVLETMKQL